MSTQKRSKKTISYVGFGGIDHNLAHSDGQHAENIINFRILKNGALQKRQGFRPFAEIAGTVRAISCNIVNGRFTTFILADNTVYTLDSDTGEVTRIGTVSTSEGKACFFIFREELFITDSNGLYRRTEDGFTQVTGYVPLLGKNWPNNYTGDIYEPRNILNNHARISYTVSDRPSVFLCAGAPIRSVEAVYLNGFKVDPNNYSVDDGFNTVDVKGLEAGDKVDVYLTYKNGYDDLYDRLCSSTDSAILGGIGNSKIFLCGNDSGTVFHSTPVSSEAVAVSRKHYPLSDELYFPVDSEADVGNGINATQAIIRYHDKILIFTEGDVWMVSPTSDDSNGSEATGINAGIGCPSKHGAALCENDPVSIGHHSIWLWSGAAGSEKNCKAKNISAQIDSELEENKLKGCGIFYDKTKNELWLYSKTEPLTWVYNLSVNAWYKFTGFRADEMFEINGKVAFLCDNVIYIFDDSLTHDIDADENIHSIEALYLSSIIDFGDTEYKNLASITLRGDLFGDTLTLEFITDNGNRIGCYLNDSKNSEHSIISKRMSSGRFKYGRLSLSSVGDSRQLIHGLTLGTR